MSPAYLKQCSSACETVGRAFQALRLLQKRAQNSGGWQAAPWRCRPRPKLLLCPLSGQLNGSGQHMSAHSTRAKKSNDALAGFATAPSGCLVETPQSAEHMSTPSR